VAHASRGYREINALALRLLPPRRLLATCSCSLHDARPPVPCHRSAAHDAGVQLKQVEERQQAPRPPHPLGRSETHYLDFFVFQVI